MQMLIVECSWARLIDARVRLLNLDRWTGWRTLK